MAQETSSCTAVPCSAGHRYNKLQECVDLKRIVKYKREPYGVGHMANCQAMIKAAIDKMELPSVTN